MSTVLTQDEIDALLNAMNSGDEPEPILEEVHEISHVHDYNFKTANKFPKDQIRTLHMIFENFSRLLSNRLAGVMRTSCEIEVLSVEEAAFGDFSNSMPLPTILALIDLLPLKGPQLLTISSTMAYNMINRLFGGVHEDDDTSKVFTEIELVILERMVRQFMPLLVEAWEKIIPVKAKLDRIETTPQFAQIVAMNEAIAVITMSVSIGGTSGIMNFCIPHIAIGPLATQLNTKLIFSGPAGVDSEDFTDALQDRLMRTPTTLQAVFNETTASVADILRLQVGDVIQLNHLANERITVKVEHIPKFKCTIGTSGSRYAVQVDEIIKEEVDYE